MQLYQRILLEMIFVVALAQLTMKERTSYLKDWKIGQTDKTIAKFKFRFRPMQWYLNRQCTSRSYLNILGPLWSDVHCFNAWGKQLAHFNGFKFMQDLHSLLETGNIPSIFCGFFSPSHFVPFLVLFQFFLLFFQSLKTFLDVLKKIFNFLTFSLCKQTTNSQWYVFFIIMQLLLYSLTL